MRLKTIRLFGPLGKKFGKTHRLNVRSAAEAVRALSVNRPGFEKHLIDSDKQNVGYKVLVDQDGISESELKNPASKEIWIIPKLMGAGGATDKIILGSLMVIAGVAINYFSAGSLSWLGTPIATSGFALVLGGVAQAMAPHPPVSSPSESPNNQPSYEFNGPVNTTAQGQPVPLCYGRLIVGGAVISAGIAVENIMAPPAVTGNYFHQG